MTKTTSTLATSLALLVSAGCGDQTGVPQPIPIPLQVRAMSAPPDSPEKIDVVGLPGAVAGAGKVFIQGATSKAEVSSTAAGSFTASLQAKGGEQLQIRYEDSDPAGVKVPSQGVMAPRPPGPISGVTPVTAPAAGKVTVKGLSNGAGVSLVAVNVDTGAVAQATSEADKKFQLQIPAASGQKLRVYEDDGAMLSSAWGLTVP